MLRGSLMFLHTLPAQKQAPFVPKYLFKLVCMVNSLAKVSPSGTRVSFVLSGTTRECLPQDQSLDMLTACIKDQASKGTDPLL